jgi:hypothetical protein
MIDFMNAAPLSSRQRSQPAAASCAAGKSGLIVKTGVGWASATSRRRNAQAGKEANGRHDSLVHFATFLSVFLVVGSVV